MDRTPHETVGPAGCLRYNALVLLGYLGAEMKRYLHIGLVTAAATVSALAWAQTAGPAKSAADAKAAIEARQALFKEIKKTYEPLTDVLKGKREFDAALFVTN